MVAIGAAPEALVRAADDTFTNLTVGTPLWQPTACHRLERIFWVHSPKAASSFSITVCATSSPSCVCCTRLSERTLTFASHSSTIQITLHETLPSTPAESSATPSFTFAQHLRNSNRSLLQQARMPFAGLITHEGFHEPMRWMSKIPHRDVGNVVAIFRRPLQRLLSARAYLRKHPRHCCGLDWGLWPRRREQARAAASAREFALLPGMRGCQAKMLLGVRM
jgi:hypothetical protein